MWLNCITNSELRMKNELVTVYIPTHNRPEMLVRAVSSVLAQTYKNIEIIISDDGSNIDVSSFIYNEFGARDNIRVIRNDISKGACHARNKAIFEARGEFVTGLDDDDEFLPERIEKLVAFFVKNKYPFISTGLVFKTKKNEIIAYGESCVIKLDDNLNSNEIGNQIFTRTADLKSIGGFDESLNAFQDYDCWLRMILKYGHGYNTGEPTYIVHMEHEEGRISTSDKRLNGILCFVEKHKKILSNQNRKNLISSFYINSGRDISLKTVIVYITPYNAMKLIKVFFKRKLFNL